MDTKLYTNLVNDIKNKIISGELSPGEKLPSENELLDLYNISKTTISKSMQILANEGYIVTVPRVGNYVSKPKFSTFRLHYDEKEILNRMSDRSQIVNYSLGHSSEKYGNILKYTTVYHQENIAVCLIDSSIYFNGALVISEDEIAGADYFALLKRYHNLHALTKKMTTEAVICPPEIAFQLNISPEDTVLKVTTAYFDENLVMVGDRIAYYHSKFIELQFTEL